MRPQLSSEDFSGPSLVNHPLVPCIRTLMGTALESHASRAFQRRLNERPGSEAVASGWRVKVH